MSVEEFKNLLNNSPDKLQVFSKKDELKKCDFSIKELTEIINEFLTDEQKEKLFEFEHFLSLQSTTKFYIVRTISDNKIKMNLLNNEKISKGFSPTQTYTILENLDSSSKSNFLKKLSSSSDINFSSYELINLIKNLDENDKVELLNNTSLIKDKFKLSDQNIISIISSLSKYETKEQFISTYSIPEYQQIDIFLSLTDEEKTNILTTKSKSFSNYNLLSLLKSYSPEGLIRLFNEHYDILSENEISPYQIIYKLKPEKQETFIKLIENSNLPLDEKKKIFATLDNDLKEKLKKSDLSEDYAEVLNIKLESNSKINVNLSSKDNLQIYKGLDNILNIENIENLSDSERENFYELCDICPNIRLYSDWGDSFPSFSKEYKKAEKWIDEILEKIPSSYSDAQKLAIIDNAIGSRISYSPDFDTEVFSSNDSRSLWRIIDTGYGVCNGIADVERYILKRVGIQSEVISSGSHAFLKIKDISLPLSNGETVTGNTIVDPTWNLTAQRFNGIPNNFCISYEKARKNDIDSKGKDHKCHLNDEALSDVNISLDEKSLRALYSSVGLADRDGNFPFKSFAEKSDLIHKQNKDNPLKDINEQLELFSSTYPDFAKSQNSAISVISCYSLSNEDLNINNCVVSRVYKKDDESKTPYIYIYVDVGDGAKKFFYIDKETSKSIELPQEEFTKEFDCYSADLEKTNGIRPWEEQKHIKEELDLSRSSGKMVAQEEKEI